MKKYILVEAATNSEWDSVSFALVPLTKRLIEQTRNIQNALLEMKEKYGVNEMTVWDANVHFFIDTVELPKRAKLDNNFSPVDQVIELKSIKHLTPPENALDCFEIAYSEMYVSFSAKGKHTGEEFWCTVSYETILAEEMQAA